MTKQHLVLFRSLTSLLFIYAGIKHLLHPEKVFSRIAASNAYAFINHRIFFVTSVYITGIILVAGGIMLLTGYKQRLAAWTLLMVLIPITLTVQLEDLNDL